MPRCPELRQVHNDSFNLRFPPERLTLQSRRVGIAFNLTMLTHLANLFSLFAATASAITTPASCLRLCIFFALSCHSLVGSSLRLPSGRSMHALQLLLRSSKHVRQPASLGSHGLLHSLASVLYCQHDRSQAGLKTWSNSATLSRALTENIWSSQGMSGNHSSAGRASRSRLYIHSKPS